MDTHDNVVALLPVDFLCVDVTDLTVSDALELVRLCIRSGNARLANMARRALIIIASPPPGSEGVRQNTLLWSS